MRFIELHVERFNRFKKPFTINLDNAGLVLVEGENQDQGGSNGAGKSLIWETLLWCLYGKMARYGDRQVAAQASHPTDGADVTVTFDLADYSYEVQRSRSAKGSPEFKVRVAPIVDGMVQDFEPFRGISRDPRKKLDDVADLLGFDYAATRASIILQGVGTELARAGFAAQMGVLESILRLSELSTASDIARKQARGISDELARAQGSAGVWERTTKQAEADLRDAQRAATEQVNAEHRKRLEQGIVDAKKIAAPLSKLEAAERELAAEYETLQQRYGEARGAWTAALDHEARLKTDVSKSVCPTCLRAFKKGDTSKLKKHLAESSTKVASAKKAVEAIERQRQVKSTAIGGVTRDVDAARKAAGYLNQLEGQLQLLDAQAQLRAEAVAAAESRLSQAQINWTESLDAVEEIQSRLSRKTFWVDGYGRDGLQADIFNAGVPQLNHKAREFSERLTRGALTVSFDPFRGSRTEDLIRIGGASAQTYDGLSSGEKQKADVIIAFAHRALARWRLPEPVNLTVCDEVFDHIDPDGLELIARLLLDEIAGGGSTFVVTHNPAMKRLFPSAQILRVVRKDNEAVVVNS